MAALRGEEGERVRRMRGDRRSSEGEQVEEKRKQEAERKGIW